MTVRDAAAARSYAAGGQLGMVGFTSADSRYGRSRNGGYSSVTSMKA